MLNEKISPVIKVLALIFVKQQGSLEWLAMCFKIMRMFKRARRSWLQWLFEGKKRYACVC